MENTLRNWSHILSASMKNEAANATVRAAMDVGGAFPNLKAGFEWQLDDDGRNGKVYSTKSGKIVGDGSLKPEYTSSDGKGLIKTMIDGKPAYFEIIDPLLIEAIMSIGYMGPKSKFLDVARDFKNILQFGVTVSPAFKVRNLIRDSVQSAAVSGIGLNIAKNVTQGIAASKKIGGAVVRNRIRRRLKVIARDLAPAVKPGTDLLIGVRASASVASSAQLRAALTDCLRRGKLFANPATEPRA
jgi:ribonuclease P protein component